MRKATLLGFGVLTLKNQRWVLGDDEEEGNDEEGNGEDEEDEPTDLDQRRRHGFIDEFPDHIALKLNVWKSRIIALILI